MALLTEFLIRGWLEACGAWGRGVCVASGQGRVVSGGRREGQRVLGPVSGKPRSNPHGMPLTGQNRSDGLRAHPKCVVIDSDGEVHGRGAGVVRE